MSHLEFHRQGPRGIPNTEIRHADLGAMRVPGFADVSRAATALKGHLRETPLLRSASLDELAGGCIWLKAENLQVTNSFKARGALNTLLAMAPEQRQKGVVAYSTGNHGQAVAWAAKTLGIPATIVMPLDAPVNKIAKAKAHGAEVVHYDRVRESREAIGMQLLLQKGGTLVPPGDHPHVLAAQGTVALEAWRQLPAEARDDLVLFAAPCGGGGLIAGCGLVMQHLRPATRLMAVEPASYDDTVCSLLAGQRLANRAGGITTCDALQAAIPAELPFEINRNLLDQACSVTEHEVQAAVKFAAEELRLVVEPGGAVALAAVLAGRIRLAGGHAVVVLSGGNIDSNLLATSLSTDRVIDR